MTVKSDEFMYGMGISDPREYARNVMLFEFAPAWDEYCQIFAIIGNTSRDFLKGHGFKEMLSKATKWRGEFFTVGEDFWKKVKIDNHGEDKVYAGHYLKTPTCFVKFSPCDKRYDVIFITIEIS